MIGSSDVNCTRISFSCIPCMHPLAGYDRDKNLVGGRWGVAREATPAWLDNIVGARGRRSANHADSRDLDYLT